jgi:hypothetical protein
MHSVLVFRFAILLEPDALNQEIIDIFEPHPPSFCWTQRDPFDGGFVNLVKSDPKIFIDLRLTDLLDGGAVGSFPGYTVVVTRRRFRTPTECRSISFSPRMNIYNRYWGKGASLPSRKTRSICS